MPLSRRQLLRHLPALGAVLCGVTLPVGTHQARRSTSVGVESANASTMQQGTILGEPLAGLDHGPALGPASAADLEPGNWTSAPASRTLAVTFTTVDAIWVSPDGHVSASYRRVGQPGWQLVSAQLPKAVPRTAVAVADYLEGVVPVGRET